MPPKTFKCVICGNDVTKPKSWAYKDGRACRTHQEAEESHESSKKKEEKRKERNKVEKEERKYSINHPQFRATPEALKLRAKLQDPHFCHICDRKDGLTPQEFMIEHMLDIHEFPKSMINLLSAGLSGDRDEHNRITKGVQDRAGRVVIPCGRPERYKFRVDNNIFQLYQFRIIDILACGDCRKKYGLKIVDWYGEQLKENQKQTDEQFTKMIKGDKGAGAMALLGAVMKPALDQAIDKRQSRQSKNN